MKTRSITRCGAVVVTVMLAQFGILADDAHAMGGGGNGTAITVTDQSIDLGMMLVGETASDTAQLNKSGGQPTTYTATSNSNGLSVTAPGSFGNGSNLFHNITLDLLNNANGSATSGAKNYTVTIDNIGENSDPNDIITVAADIYQAAAVTANTAGPALGHGELATVTNAASSDGGQRASAIVSSYNVTGAGWSATSLTPGVTGTGVATNAAAAFSGVAQFDGAGLLNGRHKGTLSIWLQHDQSIAGTSANDINGGNAFVWNLAQNVTGNNGAQFAVVQAGRDLGEGSTSDRLRGRSDEGLDTVATLLDGTTTTATTITMDWQAAGDPALISDVLTLSGLDQELFVLQLTYDANVGTPAYLGWFNGVEWVNAIEGNYGSNLGGFVGDRAYDESIDLVLGTWGVDTTSQTAWAVLDHNSDFAVLIPEPASLAMLACGALLMISRRRQA